MSPRTPTVGGNWKMNTDRAGAARLALGIARAVPPSGVEITIFPPFPYLLTVAEALASSPAIRLGAQDAWPKPNGAFTGEVSIAMLRDCGVRTILTGHSERRHIIGEPEGLIADKTAAALDAGLDCILCIGETLEQRLAGRTDEVNSRQLRAGLAGLSQASLSRLTIAYEPVWAIGTGKTATPSDAQTSHAHIRQELAAVFSPAIAAATRIQYGGSVKASNAGELFGQPDIDGGLIGGASLAAEEFVRIVAAASGAKLPS